MLDDGQTGNINDLIGKMFYIRRLNDREEALGNTPSRADPNLPKSGRRASGLPFDFAQGGRGRMDEVDGVDEVDGREATAICYS